MFIAVNAAGETLPPSFVFKGKEGLVPAQQWLKDEIKGSTFSQTSECSCKWHALLIIIACSDCRG
jgi:hypothetical protein